MYVFFYYWQGHTNDNNQPNNKQISVADAQKKKSKICAKSQKYIHQMLFGYRRIYLKYEFTSFYIEFANVEKYPIDFSWIELNSVYLVPTFIQK